VLPSRSADEVEVSCARLAVEVEIMEAVFLDEAISEPSEPAAVVLAPSSVVG
jgi:hypothetical protein